MENNPFAEQLTKPQEQQTHKTTRTNQKTTKTTQKTTEQCIKSQEQVILPQNQFTIPQDEDNFYKCGLCDSEFHKLSHLHIHRARFHYKKLYKCFCDVVCRNEDELRRHVEEVHEEKLRPSTEKRLKEQFLVECTHCDVTFSSLKSFENHIKILDETKKAFSCPVCQSTFTCEKNLRIHFQLSHDPVSHKIQTSGRNIGAISPQNGVHE